MWRMGELKQKGEVRRVVLLVCGFKGAEKGKKGLRDGADFAGGSGHNVGRVVNMNCGARQTRTVHTVVHYTASYQTLY